MSENKNNTDPEFADDNNFEDEAVNENAKQEDLEQNQGELTQEQQLKEQCDELEQKLLRVSADYQNFMRRSRKEIESAKNQQIVSMARNLVTVLDNFDHALEAASQDTKDEQLLKGVVMVRDELMRVMGNFGVKRIDAQEGQPFDPNFHEAMMRQQSENIESNHITAQLQPGYALGDTAIRPVKVAVAQ